MRVMDELSTEELAVRSGVTAQQLRRLIELGIITAGHGLELAAVGQPDATHDVQLPQLHRPGAFPAPVAGLGALAGGGAG
jgi:hypothetical protein